MISEQRAEVEALRARGIQALFGEASNIELLERRTSSTHAWSSWPAATRRSRPLIVERAKALNPALDFVVRTQSDEETAQLRAISPKVQAVHGQRELAVQMARYSLRRFGVNAVEAESIAQGLRGRPVAAVLRRRGTVVHGAALGGRLRSIRQRLSGAAGRGTLTGLDVRRRRRR